MPDIYLRPVPSDATVADVRLYDTTTPDAPAGGAVQWRTLLGVGFSWLLVYLVG